MADDDFLLLMAPDGEALLAVSPSRGAEVTSWRIRHGGEWREFIYKTEGETLGWPGGAPWLFPAVGRNYAPGQWEAIQAEGQAPAEGSWVWQGQLFPMPIHGFVRRMAWEVEAQSEGSMVCLLRDHPFTRRFYPFGFELRVIYRVEEQGWRASVRLRAAPGQEAMPFSLGNHLTVRVPFNGGEWEEYRLLSSGESEYCLNPYGLLTGERMPFPLASGLSLADPRLHNAVLGDFPPGAVWVELQAPSGERLRVAQREVSSWAPPSAFHFVFYAVPQQGFFCPEPWLGRPNSLNTGEGLLRLPPGEEFGWEMEVRYFPP